MSILYNDKSGATPQAVLLAGNANTDQILNGQSRNAIANKAVYAALQDKIDKAVQDLVYYYTKSDVYNKAETRALLSTISSLDIKVVNSLPVSDISTTTIYFLKPTGSQNYDEYVYVDNAWVKIGDTSIDLSQYLEIDDFNVAIADYYTKAEINNMLNSYYTKAEIDADFYNKDAVDDLLDAKQNTLMFDSTPTASSSNPVTSNGIKTAIDARIFSNPNLLDNPFFSVNSRGKSVYPGEGTVSTYCVDRWSLYNWWSSSSTTACVLNSDGTITLNNNTETSNRQFVQFVPFEYLRVGESYTASIDVVSITGSASFNMQQDTSPWTGVSFVSSITSPGIKTGTKNWVEVTDTKVRLFISLAANTSITIRAMKLEKGPISTLNLDTVPNYATELAKCRASKADSTDTFANQGSYFLSADNGILGAKNLLPNNKTTATVSGVTYTSQSDGSFIVTGATTTSPSYSDVMSSFTLPAGTYIFSSPNTDITSNIELVLDDITSGTAVRVSTLYNSTAVTFTLGSTRTLHCYMWVNSNITLPSGGVHFYPMIRLATDADSTYVPYAMTNRELTETEVKILTLDSRYASSGAVYYVKVGRVVVVSLEAVVLTSSATNTTPICTLPIPIARSSNTRIRACGWTTTKSVALIEVDATSGALTFGGTIPSTSEGIYGQIVYIS